MVNWFIRDLPTPISRVDSKGRITIPIGLRAKLGLLEGSFVNFQLKGSKLVVIPISSGGSLESSMKTLKFRLNSISNETARLNIESSLSKRGDKNEG